MSTATASRRKSPRKSPAATEASRERQAAKVAELGEKLEAAVAALGTDTQWTEVLESVAAFGARYSWGNQLLIMVQCAERGYAPTYVQGYNAWRDAGHPVRKREEVGSAISIYAPVMRKLSREEADRREAIESRRIPRGEDGRSLRPFLVGFTTASVFDLAQVTDPESFPVPAPTVRTRRYQTAGPAPELLTGDDPTGALADVERIIKAAGLDLSYVDRVVLGGANGDTNGSQVRVRNDVDDAQKIKTLVHEWAHNDLGHVGFSPARRGELSRAQRECEAESTAYIVCGALGLDTGTYSAPYVNTWSKGEPETVRAALEAVTTSARTMISALTPEAE